MYFSCIYISVSLITFMIAMVSTQLNLCSSDFKIDSISYLPDRNQWFFTSNGHYWVIKDSDLREFKDEKISEGKQLPFGFKRGDAAVYKNSLKACETTKTNGKVHKEQEIILVEKIGDMNTIMIYDLRESNWKEPHPYDIDKGIGQAQVHWPDIIDAMFAYNTTQIYVIQKERYAGIDFTPLCKDPDSFADKFTGNNFYDLNTKDRIDAITLTENNKFLMFQGRDVYEGTIDKVENGKLTTTKDVSKNIVKEFFHYKGCTGQTTDQTTDQTTAQTKDLPEGNNNEITNGPELPGEVVTVGKGGDEPEGGLWIIILIIIIIVIIVFAVLIAIFVVRNKRSDPEDEYETSSSTTMSSTGISISKVGSKAPSTMGANSPSRMSVRSKMSVSPGMTAKSKSPFSSVNKKSSPAKSSPKKHGV